MGNLITRCRVEWLDQDGKGYAVNPFIGCGYGCYKGRCWSYLQARRLGRVSSWEEWQRPRIAAKFQGRSLRVVVGREAGKLPEGANILLSATCDPFQHDFFGYNSIIENILHGLSWVKGPQLWILTKSGSGLARFSSYLIETKAKVGVTITSLEPSGWETGAEQPSLRLLALEDMKKAGLWTYISMEPWIPDVTYPKAIIEKTRSFVDWYIIGSFNYAGVGKRFYKEAVPPLVKWLEAEHIPYFLKKELRQEVPAK